MSAPVGQAWEVWAERWLSQRGLHIIARNYRCRGGEIDLICTDGDELVFVEVKQRGHGAWAPGAEAVGHRKQRRLIHAARHFLGRCPERQDQIMRFDVLQIDSARQPPEVQWIRDAFAAG